MHGCLGAVLNLAIVTQILRDFRGLGVHGGRHYLVVLSLVFSGCRFADRVFAVFCECLP